MLYKLDKEIILRLPWPVRMMEINGEKKKIYIYTKSLNSSPFLPRCEFI